MKKSFLLVLLTLIFISVKAQISSGNVVYDRLYSPSLENKGGEDPTRRVSIYLPPKYEETTDRYPVIYFLHGFTQRDSQLIATRKIDQLLNMAIAKGKIQPVILVIADHYTLYRGSFYTNSTLIGNWADFTAKDLVAHVDKNYRTIPNRDNRGLAGHSMGGHGAIKLGMLFPDVFGSVYAMSAGLLALEDEFGKDSKVFKDASIITSRESLTNGFNNLGANVLIALGRTFSPNSDKPPFFADLPYTYSGDSLIVHEEVLELWNKNLPYEMVEKYTDNLNKLTAIKLDWGRYDWFPHIPTTNWSFSQRLKELGIKHFAEEYNGSHMDKVYQEDGRLINDVLPFFNTYLEFNSDR